MTSFSARDAAAELMDESAAGLDADRLEEWLELFTDDAVYELVPRENADRGLPVSIVLCTDKRMLRDRTVSLRKANLYNLHYDGHLIGSVRVAESGEESWKVEANDAVYQTNPEGQSRLFSVGTYRDKVRLHAGRLPFSEKRVIVDTFSIPTLPATPL